MFTQRQTGMLSRSAWQVPIFIFCIIFLLIIIAGTIVLALLPLYLPIHGITVGTSQNEVPIYAVYASNIPNGRLLTLANSADVATQILSNFPHAKNTLRIQSIYFISASAAGKRKRQASDILTTCAATRALDGDSLVVQYMSRYPLTYRMPVFRQKYLQELENMIEMDTAKMSVVMKFTNNETDIVQLDFCSFTTSAINNFQPGATNTSACSSDIFGDIYVLDEDANLFRFYPGTWEIDFIGTINCSTTAYPYSMAIQRNGKAWTLFTDGNLYTFDINTAQCQTTAYVFNVEQLVLFGMTFAIDQSNNNEILYISTDSDYFPYRLATIDTDTLEISLLGYYDTISARAELASSTNGNLFGLFEGTPYIIAEINRTNGEILSKTSQNMIQYTAESSHFAFISYASNFLLFAGDIYSTEIYLYNSSTQMTTKETTIPNRLVGAGVAPCILNS